MAEESEIDSKVIAWAKEKGYDVLIKNEEWGLIKTLHDGLAKKVPVVSKTETTGPKLKTCKDVQFVDDTLLDSGVLVELSGYVIDLINTPMYIGCFTCLKGEEKCKCSNSSYGRMALFHEYLFYDGIKTSLEEESKYNVKSDGTINVQFGPFVYDKNGLLLGRDYLCALSGLWVRLLGKVRFDKYEKVRVIDVIELVEVRQSQDIEETVIESSSTEEKDLTVVVTPPISDITLEGEKRLIKFIQTSETLGNGDCTEDLILNFLSGAEIDQGIYIGMFESGKLMRDKSGNVRLSLNQCNSEYSSG